MMGAYQRAQFSMQFHTRDNNKATEKKSSSSNDYEKSFESLLGKSKVTDEEKRIRDESIRMKME